MARLTDGEPLVTLSVRVAPEERKALLAIADQDGLNLSAEFRRMIRAETQRRDFAYNYIEHIDGNPRNNNPDNLRIRRA